MNFVTQIDSGASSHLVISSYHGIYIPVVRKTITTLYRYTGKLNVDREANIHTINICVCGCV